MVSNSVIEQERYYFLQKSLDQDMTMLVCLDHQTQLPQSDPVGTSRPPDTLHNQTMLVNHQTHLIQSDYVGMF